MSVSNSSYIIYFFVEYDMIAILIVLAQNSVNVSKNKKSLSILNNGLNNFLKSNSISQKSKQNK